MWTQAKTPDDWVLITFRFKERLRKLKVEAVANERTLTAEVIYRLSQSLIKQPKSRKMWSS